MTDKLRLEVLLAAVDKVSGPLKAIQTGSRATAKSITETEAALKKLNGQEASLRRFHDSTAAMKDTKSSLAAARAGYQQLAGQTNISADAQQNHTKQLSAAAAVIKKLEIQLDKQTEAAKRARLQLAERGVNDPAAAQQRLADGIRAANAQIDLQRRKMEQQRQVEERLVALREKHAATMGKLGMAAAASGGAMMAGQKIKSTIMPAIDAFADAEDAQSQLKISFMQADGSVVPEYQQILELANQLGDRLPGTTADFIKMFTVLRKEGMSAKSVLGGLGTAAANLGVLLRVQPEEAAARMAKMQDALGAREDEMLEIADLMQRGEYTGSNMAFMQSAIGNAAPIMDVLKVKGVEAMRILAPMAVIMNQAGMDDGGSVGNATRKMIDRAMSTKKVSKANEELKKAGAKFRLDFTDGKGEFGGLDKLFDQLAKLRSLSGTTKREVINQLWGDDNETSRVLSKWINDGKDGYTQTVQKMQAQADLQQRVNEQLNTLRNVADGASGAYTNLLQVLGQSINAELKDVIKWLGNVAVAVKDWATANPKLTKTLMLAAAGLAAVLTIGGALGVGLIALLGPIMMLRFLSARFALSLLGIAAAGGQAGAGASVAARAAMGLVSAWQAFRQIGAVGLLASMGARAVAMLGSLKTLGGLVAILKGGLWGLLKLVFTFARRNPIAAAVLGIAGAVAGFVAHWDKIKEFWDKNEWWNLAKEIWAAIEWGLNGASGGLYEFFMTMAKKALGAVWAGMRAAVGMGGSASDDSPEQVAGRAKATAAAFALAAGATAGPSVGAQALQDGQQFQDKQELLTLQPKAAAPVSISSNNTFNIAATPGMDERAVARAITFEMDRRDRQTAARRGSLLGDID